MTKLSITPVRVGESEHFSSVLIDANGASAEVGILFCSDAWTVIEAFIEHIETGERRSVMVSEGQFLFELKLTRLRTKRHRIRVARGVELGGSVPFSGKVIMKEDVELEELRTAVEAAQRLYRDGGVIDPDDC